MDTKVHSQREMAFLAEVRGAEAAPLSFISKSSDIGSIRYAAQRCGMDDYEIAEALHISPGYMSKVMKGTAGFYGLRLVRFMRITGSLAPLQWLADQMGCELVQRDPAKARIQALERELEEARKQLAA